MRFTTPFAPLRDVPPITTADTAFRLSAEWVEVDAKALKGTYKAAPQRSELPSTINESLVVELYSK